MSTLMILSSGVVGYLFLMWITYVILFTINKTHDSIHIGDEDE